MPATDAPDGAARMLADVRAVLTVGAPVATLSHAGLCAPTTLRSK